MPAACTRKVECERVCARYRPKSVDCPTARKSLNPVCSFHLQLRSHPRRRRVVLHLGHCPLDGLELQGRGIRSGNPGNSLSLYCPQCGGCTVTKGSQRLLLNHWMLRDFNVTTDAQRVSAGACHSCCASVTTDESCGAHLSVRPSGDSILTTQFLERCQADPELLCHLFFWHDKVLAERLKRVDLGRCRPGDDASALLPGWPHSCYVSLASLTLALEFRTWKWKFKMRFRLQHVARAPRWVAGPGAKKQSTIPSLVCVSAVLNAASAARGTRGKGARGHHASLRNNAVSTLLGPGSD
jgi:hypothetical protein